MLKKGSCADASAELNAMASATPAPSRKRFLIPLTSARKYACDDGYATTVAPMITIDFCDGNGFLAREARQSGRRRKTPPEATFVQQFAWNAANLPGCRRDICATPGECQGNSSASALAAAGPKTLCRGRRRPS
jgi:hypothetical protein